MRTEARSSGVRWTVPSEFIRKLVACEICMSTPEDKTRGYPSKIAESFTTRSFHKDSLTDCGRIDKTDRTGDCLEKSGSRSGMFMFLSEDRLRAMASSAVL